MQEVRQHKKRVPKHMDEPNIFSGLVFCADCGKPLVLNDIWLKRGNTGYYTEATCPDHGPWFLRFKLNRRDGLHWSFARCTEPATPEADAKWDKQKAALLERMKRKANKE